MVDAMPHALGLNPILISPNILEIGPRINAKLREIMIVKPAHIINIVRIKSAKKGPIKPDLAIPPTP